jgi:hypothetical protein
MKLHTLMFGRSKAKMKPIMTDSLHKVTNYRNARRQLQGHHSIVDAHPGATVWRQQSATIGGNRPTDVPRVGRGHAGYISKTGFNAHT